MPAFKIFGLIAAILFVVAALMAMNKKFKYHKYVAYSAVVFMLMHVAGAFGLY